MVLRVAESANIESDLRSIVAPQDTFPGVGGVEILVRSEDAEEAGKIIESFRQSPLTDEETPEVHWLSATSGVTDLPSR